MVDSDFDTMSLFGTASSQVGPSEAGRSALGSCFAAGTLIETSKGPVPVETLKPGDRLVTHTGDSVPLRRVAVREVDLGACPNRLQVLPICIKAGALGAGAPFSDLFVSPDHALFFYGVLVPAHNLLNELSILQPSRGGVVTYHHLQCDRHVVILANGAQAESSLDLGERPLGDQPARAPMSELERTARLAAPYAGRKLAASVRQNLLARAERARMRGKPASQSLRTFEAA